MSNPSNLKVKRLVELPLLPDNEAGDAITYAVVDSVDYKLNVQALMDAAADGVFDEVVEILSPVAVSNSYNDLDDKPFIPQNSDELPQGSTNLYATAAEKAKLAGIQAGAQVNSVTSVAGKTGAVTLVPADVGAEAAFSKGSIVEGAGVVISGTLTNRLVGAGDITITSTGIGGGVVVEVVPGTGIAVDNTDVASPVVSLTSGAQASLALADSATQPGDLAPVATSGAYSDLSSAPGESTSIALTGGEWQRAALIGDVTAPANSNTTLIANMAVTNAKMSNMAAGTIKGRASGAGSGAPTDLTPAEARAVLNVADGAQANVATNLTQGTPTATTVPVNSSTGTAATLTAATTSVAGLMSAADKVALAGKANLSGAAFTGAISATTVSGSTGVYSSEHFISSTTSATLSTASAGVIRLRPNDAGSTVGQLYLDSQGNVNLNGAIANSARINLFCGTSDGIPGITFWNNASAFKGGVYWNGPTDSIDFFTSSDGSNPRMRLANSGRLETVSGYSMGTNVASSATDLSKHVALYGTNYGLSITSNTLNVVTNGSVSAAFTSSGVSVAGTVSDANGNVRKLSAAVSNTNNTSDSTWANKVIEKSDNGSYNFTIAAGTGTHSDAITFVNSGTAGNITLVQGAGVALMKSGVVSNITVPPGSIVTIYHSATANRWVA